MKKALLAGSFDPPTLGHLALIQRATLLVDKLFVAVAMNSEKRHHELFSVDERKEMLREITRHLTQVEVVSFPGLVIDFAKKMNVQFLIRGIRSSSDWEREEQMAIVNRKVGNIETVFLMPDPEHTFISSTLIRELASNQARLNAFVPAALEDKIFSRLKAKI